MADENNVQQEPASGEEQVSTTAETPKEGEKAEKQGGDEQKAQEPSQPQFITEKRLREILAEDRRRTAQSTRDISRSEFEKALQRATLSENTLTSVKQILKDVDPELLEKAELAELRARVQSQEIVDQEDLAKQQYSEFVNTFTANMSQFIEGLGIDPEDARIDWASDARTALEAQQRILSSVATIQIENAKSAQTSIDSKIKEATDKLRQELGAEANSVDTSSQGGVMSQSDRAFVHQMAEGELPMTNENLKRLEKIQATY